MRNSLMYKDKLALTTALFSKNFEKKAGTFCCTGLLQQQHLDAEN